MQVSLHTLSGLDNLNLEHRTLNCSELTGASAVQYLSPFVTAFALWQCQQVKTDPSQGVHSRACINNMSANPPTCAVAQEAQLIAAGSPALAQHSDLESGSS